jgi:hypothetical protein
MGSFKNPRVFNPLDLEVMERVYEAAWAKIEALEPFRDRQEDDQRKDALRKLVMDNTDTHKVDFDALYERVVKALPEKWTIFTGELRSPSGGAPEVL